ncbi:MAG: hypothetical protein ACK4GL_10835 [Flavobacteriales bacterium]
MLCFFTFGLMLSWFDIALTSFYALVIFAWMFYSRFFHLAGLHPRFSVIAFSVKIISGFLLTWIYTAYYDDRSQSDIFKFFDDSKYIYQALEHKPADFFSMVFGLDQNRPYYDQYYYQMSNWFKSYDSSLFNDTRTMIRLNAFIRLFSFGVYHVHTLFFSLLTFLGLIFIYKAMYRWFADRTLLLALSLFLMPSVLCWTSGVLKEAVLFLGLGFLLYGLSSCYSGKLNWKSIKFILPGVLLMLVVKPYILAALIPGVIALISFSRIKGGRIGFHFAGVYALSAIAFWLLAQLEPQYNILEQLSERQQSVQRLAFYVDSGSLVYAAPLNPNIWSLLRNLPEALINAAFRPSILDADNSLKWLAAFENLLIIIILVFCIGLFKYDPKKLAVWLFLMSFVFIVYALSGLTTPVLGTLVRYRVPALPFFMMLMFMMMDYERLKRILNETFGKIE